MDDIFGRVISIFIAVCIMFGMPFIYMTERAKSARQMYILSEVTHFVDSVANTGFINREMMREFYNSLSFSDRLENIAIIHESDEFAMDEKTYVRVKTFYDEEDIWSTVEKGEDYRFLKGDYLKVTVKEDNAFSLFPFLKDDTVTVVYGGCIKYETD